MTPLFERVHYAKTVFPIPKSGYLEELALEVSRQSSKLGSVLHPITRHQLRNLFDEMDGYYSNLIEGHKIALVDIRKAIKKEFFTNLLMRNLQKESIAHIEALAHIRERLKTHPNTKICHSEFLHYIHAEYCKQVALDPVANENKPKQGKREDILAAFEESYNPDKLNVVPKIIALAASHHSLAWIQPFLHHNGRITRLFSSAFIAKIKVDGEGLWSLSRGLANHHHHFYPVKSGTKKESNCPPELRQFSEFFLEMVLNQIDFSSKILNPVNLEKRIANYVDEMHKQGQLQPQVVYLLLAAFIQGEINLQEIPSITSLSAESANQLLVHCLEKGLLVTTEKSDFYSLGFPIGSLEYYFPGLYLAN